MSETFFHYLHGERSRLEAQLATERSAGLPDREVTRLEELRAIVDDQIERWSRDLSDRMAA